MLLVGILEILNEASATDSAERHHTPPLPEDSRRTVLVRFVTEDLMPHGASLSIPYPPAVLAENIVQVNQAA